jgi:hypothetical protein
MPILLFVEATIYQMDEENEEVGRSREDNSTPTTTIIFIATIIIITLPPPRPS